VLHLNSISPVPDLAVLLFATDMEHTPLPQPAAAAVPSAGAASSNSSDAVESAGDSSGSDDEQDSSKPVEAVLLGGYARYLLDTPSDLAALLQLREHLQLLLQMKVRPATRLMQCVLQPASGTQYTHLGTL
jgi:hypothetical protein